MKIKGVFHCPQTQFKLAKELGFTHVQILNHSSTYPEYEEMKDRIKLAHDLELNCIIDPHLFVDVSAGMKFLIEIEYYFKDIIYICDEPNRKNISPASITQAHLMIDDLKYIASPPRSWNTMISLSPTHSFDGYEKVCNYVGISYYRGFAEGLLRWSLPKLLWKIMKLRFNNPGISLVAIPAVKISPKHLENQVKFWESMGVKDFIWYSWTPNQERPYWLEKELTNLYDYQEMFKKINS